MRASPEICSEAMGIPACAASPIPSVPARNTLRFAHFRPLQVADGDLLQRHPISASCWNVVGVAIALIT
jgi:hypothetical protein